MRFGTYPIGHLGLRVGNLARAKRFHVDTLGFGLVREASGAVFMDAHGVLIARLGPADHAGAADRFDPFRVGLDHLAMGNWTGLREQLDAAGVSNHGIERDSATCAAYISVYDPDGIAWELYALLPR